MQIGYLNNIEGKLHFVYYKNKIVTKHKWKYEKKLFLPSSSCFVCSHFLCHSNIYTLHVHLCIQLQSLYKHFYNPISLNVIHIFLYIFHIAFYLLQSIFIVFELSNILNIQKSTRNNTLHRFNKYWYFKNIFEIKNKITGTTGALLHTMSSNPTRRSYITYRVWCKMKCRNPYLKSSWISSQQQQSN